MASVQSSRCKGTSQKNTICHRSTKDLNGFCYQHQDQFQSNPAIAINPSGKACIPSSIIRKDLAERGADDSPIIILDEKEPNPVPAVTNSASSAALREFGHSAFPSAEFSQERHEGAQTPANPLPPRRPSDSSANAGFMSLTEENKVANHEKQTSSLFTKMCEEEQARILVYIRGMLGMNAHGAS